VILYPAIDIADGRAVRLRQGRFEDATVYADDPLSAARDWVQQGARALHVVDLDGARAGTPAALGHLERIAAGAGVPVQYGGGLRRVEDCERAVEVGAARIVIGTAAFSDVDLLDDAVERFGDRVVVSVDVRDGRVAAAGWTESTGLEPAEVIERLQDRGVRSFVYTSVDRDGMLEGIDAAEVWYVAGAVRGRFLYSGGIGSLEDLRALAKLRAVNLAGAIVGKALYEGRFTIAEGQAALDNVSDRG
jgi:phosphoribosylformimino-5-aminoimidazole carboxamide ribotide isomerase